jgi:ribose transport system permease protein
LSTRTHSAQTDNILSRQQTQAHVRAFLGNYAIYIILLALIIIAVLAAPAFTRERNILNLLRQASILGVVAIGQTFVILSGGIDLSVASVMALMSVLSANLMDGQDERVGGVVLLCLGIAALIGLINGVMVTRLRIPPFIATLGMILVVQGVRFIYTGGAPKGSIPEALRFWGRGSISTPWVDLPSSLILCLAVLLLAALLLNRSTFGRRLYAVGGNIRTAHLSGVQVNTTVMIAYVWCSLLAGIAGLMLTGYIGLADNWLGRGFELDSIAAVVIGGTALAGGRGSVLWSIAGVLIMVILFNLVLLLRLDEETQRIIKGVVIIAAVALYERLRSAS